MVTIYDIKIQPDGYHHLYVIHTDGTISFHIIRISVVSHMIIIVLFIIGKVLYKKYQSNKLDY